MQKNLSVGLILHTSTHILGCIPWGKRDQLDIPKGRVEEGEELLEALHREVYEETGLDIAYTPIEELGPFEYNEHKDLWLFSLYVEELPPTESLNCSSTFINPWGKEVPEMIGFTHQPLDNLSPFYYNLQRILSSIFYEN